MRVRKGRGKRLGVMVVAVGICVGLGGCGARAASAAKAFSEAIECADLQHGSNVSSDAPAARAIDFDLAYDRADSSDHAWVPAIGMAPDQAYVADALGLNTQSTSGATRLIIRYSEPTPCASTQLATTGQALSGCRVDGCRLEGRVDGRRISSLSVFVPARPDGDVDEITRTQGRCVVAAVGVAAGLQDLWRDDLQDAVILGPSHYPSQAVYRWQVNSASKFHQCLLAVRAEIR